MFSSVMSRVVVDVPILHEHSTGVCNGVLRVCLVERARVSVDRLVEWLWVLHGLIGVSTVVFPPLRVCAFIYCPSRRR